MAKKSRARFFRVGGKYTHPTGVPFQVLKIRPTEQELGVQFIGPDGTRSTTTLDLIRHKKLLQRGEIEEIQ
jgi:hypothetical protein